MKYALEEKSLFENTAVLFIYIFRTEMNSTNFKFQADKLKERTLGHIALTTKFKCIYVLDILHPKHCQTNQTKVDYCTAKVNLKLTIYKRTLQ